MRDAGVQMTVEPAAKAFTFAGGDRCDVKTRVCFKVQAIGNQEVRICCIDRPAPILLGNDALKGCAWSSTTAQALCVPTAAMRCLCIDSHKDISEFLSRQSPWGRWRAR